MRTSFRRNRKIEKMVHLDLEDLKLSKNSQIITRINQLMANMGHESPYFVLKRSYPRYLQEAFEAPENIISSKNTKIEKIIVETPECKTFLFKYPEIAEATRPGQFLMVNVFRKFNTFKYHPDEFPMSLSYIEPEKGLIGITVEEIGKGTKALHKHRKGDIVGIRGPYGQGFHLENTGSNIVFVGGGVGVAPLAPLIEQLKNKGKEVTVLMGARTKQELLFVKRLRKLKIKLEIATDDGSEGKKGNVIDLLEELLNHNASFTDIIVCGPELVIKKVLEIAKKHRISMQASLERYMKCGRGICGHCHIDGLMVCVDGPVFTLAQLDALRDLGIHVTDAYGRRKVIR